MHGAIIKNIIINDKRSLNYTTHKQESNLSGVTFLNISIKLFSLWKLRAYVRYHENI